VDVIEGAMPSRMSKHCAARRTRANRALGTKRRAWRPAARYVMTTSDAGKRTG